jgi:hypothetical protein
MALQDLTPQLRTRMTRVERLVGLFVLFAVLLTLVGFVYYVVSTGKRRGWFVNKVPYYCYVADATGLKAGDPVRMLGREVGRIVEVEACPPDPWFIDNNYNVFVKFDVWTPYFGYIWTDSRVRVVAADFFGSRYLEVVRGKEEFPAETVIKKEPFRDSELINDKFPKNGDPTNRVRLSQVKSGVWLELDQEPTLVQRGEQIVQTVALALPTLTNQVAQVLARVDEAVSNANLALVTVPPMVGRLEALTARLQTEDGAIGRMLLTTNLQSQVEGALASMDATLTNTTSLIRSSELQLQDLTRRIGMTLDTVSLVTSNLSAQVNANSLMLGEISSLVINADDMVQGLKRHWLLRPAFTTASNAPPESIVGPRLDVPAP